METFLIFASLLFGSTVDAEPSFKHSCRNLGPLSAYVSGQCLVLYQSNHKNRTAAQEECQKQTGGHLAFINSQEDIDKLNAVFEYELNVAAWCALTRDQSDPNNWLESLSETGPGVSVSSPFWDTSISPNPDPAGGDDGVLVGKNGLRNADSQSEHPFICQFPDSNPKLYFKESKKGFKGSTNASLEQFSVKNIHGCGIACADTYSKLCQLCVNGSASKECHLYFLKTDALPLLADIGFKLFDRIAADDDCVSKEDCKADPSHILIISGFLYPSIFSYHPGSPSENKIFYTFPAYLQTAASELIDGRILISGGGNTVAAAHPNCL